MSTSGHSGTYGFATSTQFLAVSWTEVSAASYTFDDFPRAFEHLSSDPIVSVVMPIYDTPIAFLEESVASVRAQTDPRWELLLIDDGSAETVSSCARRLADLDPSRIKYCEHEGHVNQNGNVGFPHNDFLVWKVMLSRKIKFTGKSIRNFRIMSRKNIYLFRFFFRSYAVHHYEIHTYFFVELEVIAEFIRHRV